MYLKQFNQCKFISKILYNMYTPVEIRFRRNIEYAKLKDYEAIALLLFQTILGIHTRIRFYRFIKSNNVISKYRLPEESRFNRICNNIWYLIQVIRNKVIQDKVKPRYTIIDSLPIPLCKTIRRFRAKKMKFYGFKGQLQDFNLD